MSWFKYGKKKKLLYTISTIHSATMIESTCYKINKKIKEQKSQLV